MIQLIEPYWGVTLLTSLFTWMQASVFWSYWMPILADVFVLLYPLYLLGLYAYGTIHMWRYADTESWAHALKHKTAALYILFGTLCSVVVNIGIQFFVDKVRPFAVLGLPNLKTETPLHMFLPSSSFPSDHAALTMGIAMMSVFWALRHKDKKFLRFGGILIIFSLVTSLARVTTGVHWPTDVIAGSLVGLLVAVLLMYTPLYRLGVKLCTQLATWIKKTFKF